MSISFYSGTGHKRKDKEQTHVKNLWSQEYANTNYTVFIEPQKYQRSSTFYAAKKFYNGKRLLTKQKKSEYCFVHFNCWHLPISFVPSIVGEFTL